MRSFGHFGLVLLLLATAQGCADPPPPGQTTPAPRAAERAFHWEEDFSSDPIGWASMSGHDAATVARVYQRTQIDGAFALHADHRADQDDPAPAVHWGLDLREHAPPLVSTCKLAWRWRVTKHPTVSDPWEDVAASVYVIFRAPGLFGGGQGFKFGWLAKPGSEGETQKGIVLIALRTEAASESWRAESVDLCALYRAHYGDPTEVRVGYVGVMTDADGSASRSTADYAAFSLGAR